MISDDHCVFADHINNPNDYDEHYERNVPYDPISRPCTTRTQTNGTCSTVNATYGSINTGTGNKLSHITGTTNTSNEMYNSLSENSTASHIDKEKTLKLIYECIFSKVSL